MTAARARRAPTPSLSPAPAPGAAASQRPAIPPAADAETLSAPGPVLVFPRPASDPGRLGLPLTAFEAGILEQLERKVGRDRYQGWGRVAESSAPDAPPPDFFVDVAGRRHRGETLLQAAAAAVRTHS